MILARHVGVARASHDVSAATEPKKIHANERPAGFWIFGLCH